jgi:hypothetical protein
MLLQFNYVTKFSMPLIMIYFLYNSSCRKYMRSRCRVHVTYTNLCVTHSETLHITLSYEVHHSQIVQRILDSLRMATSVCYLAMLALVYLSFVVLAA